MPVRILQSPSVYWAERENERVAKGQRRTAVEAWSGKRLGVSVVDGIAQVDESLAMTVDTRDQGPVEVPLWHIFVLELGFTDVTPAGQAPVHPLPGLKPYREEERARLALAEPARPRTPVRRVAQSA